MKVLLIGGVTREHIIAESLHKNGASIIVAMHDDNPRILKLSGGLDNVRKCLETDVTDIAKLACDKKADFAIIWIRSILHPIK